MGLCHNIPESNPHVPTWPVDLQVQTSESLSLTVQQFTRDHHARRMSPICVSFILLRSGFKSMNFGLDYGTTAIRKSVNATRIRCRVFTKAALVLS